MRIGIDGRCLSTGRAIARYTTNLLNQLSVVDRKNDYYLFIDGGQKLSEISSLRLSPKWELIKSPRKLVLKDHFLFNHHLKKFNLDLFFHPDNTEFLYCQPKSVVTIHDLIPYLYPSLSLSSNLFKKLSQRIYLRLQKAAVTRSAFRVIAVSQNSKKDLQKIFNLPGKMITVTYEAPSANFFPQSKEKIAEVKNRFGIKDEYIFTNSGFSPYKNILTLLEAFSEVAKIYPDLKLVLGGSCSPGDLNAAGGYFQKIRARASQLDLGRRVVFTDYIGEDYLPALYAGAKIFVYPSLYEGFGLPLLEAQACGLAALAASVASIPEVVGRSAGLFEPRSQSQMRDRILEILGDEARRLNLIRAGFENVKRFSWEKCARQTLEVFEEANQETSRGDPNQL